MCDVMKLNKETGGWLFLILGKCTILLDDHANLLLLF